MKKILLSAMGWLLVTMIHAQGIKFETGLSWQQVLQKAKAENKYILLDIYATWCVPCKAMDQNVYPKKEVGDYFNEKFISVRVQNDVTNEDGANVKSWYKEAARMTKEYDIRVLPSFVFLNSAGEVLNKSGGYRKPEELIEDGKKALDSVNSYSLLIKKYESGNREPSFVRELAMKAQEIGQVEKAQEIADSYIKGLTEQDLLKEENALLLMVFTHRSTDRGFNVIYSHWDEISKFVDDKDYGPNFVKSTIFLEEIRPFESSKDGKPDWSKIEVNIKKYGQIGAEVLATHRPRILYTSEIDPLLRTYPDWSKVQARIATYALGKNEVEIMRPVIAFYLNNLSIPNDLQNLMSAVKQFERNFVIPPDGLNAIAMAILEATNDKTALEAALAWSKQGIDKEPNPGFIDTYACILYKQGNKQQAIEWEEKALAKVPGNADIKATLEKMKKGENL